MWGRRNVIACSYVSRSGLDPSHLERKMRLLTLADLAFARIGQNISYEEIARALQVDEREVERWGIDGVLHEGLLW